MDVITDLSSKNTAQLYCSTYVSPLKSLQFRKKKSNDITHHTFFNEKNYKIAKLRKPIFHWEIRGRVEFKVLPIFWRQNKIFNITPRCTQSKWLSANNTALIIRLLGVQRRQGLHCCPPSCSDLFHLFQQASRKMVRVPAMGVGLALPIWTVYCQMAWHLAVVKQMKSDKHTPITMNTWYNTACPQDNDNAVLSTSRITIHSQVG